jgi:chromosome segregation ATPase
MGERSEVNGGLHFRTDPHPDACSSTTSLVGAGGDEHLAVPVQEFGNVGGGDRDEFSAAVEERRENGNPPSNLKQRNVGRQSQRNSVPRPQVRLRQNASEASSYSASGILEAVTQLHHSKMECQQRQAEIVALNGEVKDLRGQLATALEKNERLTLKVQRQTENKEILHRKLHRQISALRDNAQRSERNDERLRTQVAVLEVDRHALREKVRRVTAQYEPQIRDLENARSRLQTQISTNEAEIPRLQNVILRKEERIQELSRSAYSCRRMAVVVLLLLLLVAFLLILVAYLLWYLLG